jgi:hypothetical protein
MTRHEIKNLAMQLHAAIVESTDAIPDAREANLLSAKAHELLVLLHGYESAPPAQQRAFAPRKPS